MMKFIVKCSEVFVYNFTVFYYNSGNKIRGDKHNADRRID
jgi:hypothetical protein